MHIYYILGAKLSIDSNMLWVAKMIFLKSGRPTNSSIRWKAMQCSHGITRCTEKSNIIQIESSFQLLNDIGWTTSVVRSA